MSNMTENLYELNHLPSDSNGAYSLQNSPAVMTPTYGISSTGSMHPSAMSPHFNQRHLSSPATPQNELSPLLDVPHGGGSWDYNLHEKSSSTLWGSSSKDEMTETMGSHVLYPFGLVPHCSAALSSKFNANALQRLDSFSKAFPTKNPNLAFSNSVGEKSSEDNQVPETLMSPQSGAPSDGSDREPFSPVAVQSQPQQHHSQSMYHPMDNQHITHNLYHNHQPYHHGYQQYKQQLRESHPEQVYKLPFYKSQNQYHFQQQGIQINQNQLTPYSLALQKQHQRGPFLQQSPLEGPDSVGSPTYSYTEDYKAPEQPAFQCSQGLPLHSPGFKEPQHFHPFSHQNDLYQHQQPHEQAHTFSFKQNTSFGENHLAPLDMPGVPGFPSVKEEDCTDLTHPQKKKDLCSSHYQSVGPGANQAAQSTALRGGVLHHLSSYRQQWAQHSLDVQTDQTLPAYRKETEVVRGQGANTKLKCVVCHREFKSLPALNGHMRSHGGFRTHPSAFKTSEGQIQLSKEAAQIDPMVLPVSVPVKDYQTPSKLPNSLNCHLRQNDLSDSAEACPQLPAPTHKDQGSRAKSDLGVREGVEKGEKKRYRHCLVPLVISPCKAGLESRGPVLFQSQLRSPSSCGDDVPYTPPPMLSPVRPGSGLFSSFNAGHHSTGTQAVQRVRLCKDNLVDDGIVTVGPENKSSIMKPRINIGEDFQAIIPHIQIHSKVAEETHKATLLWTPCHLDTTADQQRVDDLLKLACSSVLPGGGTNTEYALHSLFECRGDVMITLEKLLSLEPLKHISSPQTDYHYAGSDKWTLQEKRQLNKALVIYNKDFYLIQKMVKTKTVAQCVEYYYTWKERLRLGKRLSAVPSTPGQEREGGSEDTRRQPAQDAKPQMKGLKFSDVSDKSCAAGVCEVPSCRPTFNGDEWNQSSLGGLYNPPADYSRPRSAHQLVVGSVKSSPSNSTTSGETDSTLVFPCTECGKVFFKVKSRNAHMKTHRQQDDPQFWQLHRLAEQENQTVTPAKSSVTPLQLPTTPHSIECSSGEDVKTLLINNAETLQQVDCLLQSPKFKE